MPTTIFIASALFILLTHIMDVFAIHHLASFYRNIGQDSTMSSFHAFTDYLGTRAYLISIMLIAFAYDMILRHVPTTRIRMLGILALLLFASILIAYCAVPTTILFMYIFQDDILTTQTRSVLQAHYVVTFFTEYLLLILSLYVTSRLAKV